MDNFFNKLGDFLKDTLGTPSSSPHDNDSDYNDAMDELNDFLNNSSKTDQSKPKATIPIPQELIPDYDTLQVPYTANLKTIKAQYKNLLKMYHPDKHNSNPDAIKIATDKTSLINLSYNRIETWFMCGKL